MQIINDKKKAEEKKLIESNRLEKVNGKIDNLSEIITKTVDEQARATIEAINKCNADINDKTNDLKSELAESNVSICAEINSTSKLINKLSENYSLLIEDYGVKLSKAIEDYGINHHEDIEILKQEITSILDNLNGNISNFHSDSTNIFECVNGIQNTNAELVGKLEINTKMISEQTRATIEAINKCNTDINDKTNDLKSELVDSNDSICAEIISISELINKLLGNYSSLIEDYGVKLSKSIEEFVTNHHEDNEMLKQEITSTLDNLNGNISNVHSDTTNIFECVNGIQGTNSELGDKLDEVINEIGESKDERSIKIDEIVEEMGLNSQRQSELVSNESELIDRYNSLIKYINNEVVVKLISDSDNLLNCMKDCYALLENIRRKTY
jgi:hypothetical protein